MKRASLLGAYSGAAHVVVNSALLLLFVPIFIEALGVEMYGVFALVTGLTSLNVFTNFGFTTSLIKHLSEQGKNEDAPYDIVVTFIIIGASSLVVLTVALLLESTVLEHILGLKPSTMSDDVRSFYRAAVGTGFLQMLSLIPGAVLDARRKVFVSNGISLAVGVLGKSAVIVSLVLDPDVSLVGWLFFGASFFGFLAFVYAARREWGRIECPDLQARFAAIARKHMRTGRHIYAASVVGFFYEPMAKLLMSHAVGVAAVGFFDIGLRVKGMVWSVIERMLYPAMPLIASTSRTEDARSLVEEVQHKLLLAVIPTLILCVFLSKPVVIVWLGSLLWPVVIGISSIVGVYLIALLFVPVYQYLTMKGHPEKTIVLQLTNVSVNVVFFAILVPMMDYYGALLAFCLAIIASSILSLRYQRRFLQSWPVASRQFASDLLKFGGMVTVSNLVVSLLLPQYVVQIAILPFVTLFSTAIGFRQFRMVTRSDVERYAGSSNHMSRFLQRILVAEGA